MQLLTKVIKTTVLCCVFSDMSWYNSSKHCLLTWSPTNVSLNEETSKPCYSDKKPVTDQKPQKDLKQTPKHKKETKTKKKTSSKKRDSSPPKKKKKLTEKNFF